MNKEKCYNLYTNHTNLLDRIFNISIVMVFFSIISFAVHLVLAGLYLTNSRARIPLVAVHASIVVLSITISICLLTIHGNADMYKKNLYNNKVVV